MAATVQIDEANGSAATQTTNISNSNMGSTDAANLTPASYPITAGNNSYEKWQRFHVTAMGGSTSIQNLRVWRTTALSGTDTHVTNAATSGYTAATYATPVATASTVATNAMPTADPGSANLGIGGSLTGSLTAAGYSDYLVHQLQVNSATTAGASCTMSYEYDEVA